MRSSLAWTTCWVSVAACHGVQGTQIDADREELSTFDCVEKTDRILVQRDCSAFEAADGWAGHHDDGQTTRGGADADLAHVFLVQKRSELISALYPDAVIAADGSFTSDAGADPTPKLILVAGSLELSADGQDVPIGFEALRDAAYDFAAYVEAYKPSVWNADPANINPMNNKPNRVSGPLESAREASAQRQAAVVQIAVGSNTTLLGVRGATLQHGSLVVPAGVDNVIIRNLRFEDAFDHFPTWDPSDSFVVDESQPGCQTTYVDAQTGPQRCPGGRWNSDYDNVQINGGTHVWIDHCTFSDGAREDHRYPSVFASPHVGYDYLIQHHDGAVDVTGTSNFVTVSYSHFKNHDKTHLFGSSDTATEANGFGALSITAHHNHYENAGQRLPRVRFGKVHVYDNYYQGTVGYLGQYAPTDDSVVPANRFLYGIGIGYLAKIYAESNVFDVQGADGITVDDQVLFFNWHKAAPDSGDTLDVGQSTYLYAADTRLNGQSRDLFAAANAAAAESGRPVLQDTAAIWDPADDYPYNLDEASQVKARVTRLAGAH
ncbi:MAG: PbsX family transcriptional regulator [Polyangiales bacterium]